MNDIVVLLSIPGLRRCDIARMPNLKSLVADGDQAPLVPSFPAVTWPVQTNMLTGELPSSHGVVANGFYWRETHKVEMWTAWNEVIQRPQIWDVLHKHDSSLTSAAWFPMLSKGSGADYVCMPAPVHNPDGSESLWCYTKPSEYYGELLTELDHFPLQHFWGPLANIRSTSWIADSAVLAAAKFQPRFSYIYLPHLDYAAQKDGPDSESAWQACHDLDAALARLITGFQDSFQSCHLLWLVASEYAIVPVNSVCFPNRILRDSGFLVTKSNESGGTIIDFEESRGWALVDHQFSHVFVRDSDDIESIARLFRPQSEIAEVLVGDETAKYGLNHDRSGEIVLVSQADSWQAYYWWDDVAQAPSFARTVDIHRKPGYDPVELHFDVASKSIPLDASLIKGSHGAPAIGEQQRGVLLSSEKGVFVESATADTDVFEIVLRQYGI